MSVTERTREIGVRKALGAIRFNILMQFVMEALNHRYARRPARHRAWRRLGASRICQLERVFISVDAVLLAVAFSVGVGLFFGIWPARRAAELDPIEALRHD